MEKMLAAILGTGIVASTPACAQVRWCWSFAAAGTSATGTFVTGNDADGEGFYRISGIAGIVNAATVTALQPAGTAIPGNAGFAVDNLIRTTEPQLTKHGFGFALSDGTYHNPFQAEQYRDYISRPPFTNGEGVEPTIQFKAIVAASGSHCPSE
jgi:hypothetical protein